MTWHPDMPLEYRNQIVTGDSRELAKRIPDESIDLVFCDPVYDRIDDYRWLAETAGRVLKPDSAALVWASNVKQYEVHHCMSKYLTFVLPLIYVVVANTYRMIGYNAFLWSKVCLWFAKGNGYPHSRIVDTVISHNSTANGHKWNKNPEAFVNWMRCFTDADAIVYDPFTGGGTVPAVCKMLGRNYVASEIDPDVAERARQRVLNTQPPLFVLQPEQLRMEV